MTKSSPRCRLKLAVSVASAWVSGTSLTLAQTAPPDTSSDSLAEVVVTATKRESNIQTTPMSISAVTGDQLLSQGSTTIEDIALRTPGVGMNSTGPGRTSFTMRGMAPTGGATPTVGYYIDDAPISSPAAQFSGRNAIDPSLYDIERVEVLRGPQGTLFGSGSMGGTIRIITAAPKLNIFDTSAQASFSGTERGGFNHTVNGMLNVPLGSLFALRVVASERFEDGYINRVVLNPFPAPSADFQTRGDVLSAPVEKLYKNVNDNHTQGIRASLLGQLTDTFSVRSAVLYQRIGQAGSGAMDLPTANFNSYQPFDIREGYRDAFSLYTLVLKYAFDAFSITSDASLINRGSLNTNNDSENYYSLFAPGFFTPGPTFHGTSSKEVTEEIRVTSSGSAPLQWVAGVFYDNFHNTDWLNEQTDAYIPIFGEAAISNFEERDHIRQTAAFGELSYQIADPLSATVGLRYFHYRFDSAQNGIGIVIPPADEVAFGSSQKSGFNPKATVRYTHNDGQMYYITAARGFRPGAPNPPIPGNVAQGVTCGSDLAALGLSAAPTRYDPDVVWSYEIGAKMRPTNRLQIDADAYHLLWSHIQQGFTLPCGFNFTANAGAAVANGAELEITTVLTSGLTLSQSVGYVHARLIHESIGTAATDLIQNVPEWTLSTSLDYERWIGRDWSVTAHVDDQFTDREYDPTPNPYPSQFRGGFNTVNARLGAKKHNFSASLFVRNATDRVALLGFAPGQSAFIPSVTRAIPLQPRTAGIDFQWSFK